jgi:nitroreductase
MRVRLECVAARACRSQNFIANAPAVVVGCSITDEAYARMGGYWSSSDIDVAIALDHLTLAAIEAGLGTCWIGAFAEAEVKAVLGIPAGAKPVAIIIMGYPALESAFSDVPTGGRKPREQVFSQDKF